MPYSPAPTTFEDLIQLIPPRESIGKHRFLITDKPFEQEIGRSQMSAVYLCFYAPDDKTTFWPCMLAVESDQRGVQNEITSNGSSEFGMSVKAAFQE